MKNSVSSSSNLFNVTKLPRMPAAKNRLSRNYNASATTREIEMSVTEGDGDMP